jgi:hypothetical protein
MAVEDDRSVAGRFANRAQAILEVVEMPAPAVHIRPPAARSPEAPLVVGGHVEAGRREPVADVLVAAAVLVDPVDEQDESPRAGRGRPVLNAEMTCRARG